MKPILGRFSEIVYALLRIVAGALFACHGSQKLLGLPGEGARAAGGLMRVAGVVELVCGLLIALGLLTTLAAFLASGEMAVAYFTTHAPQGFWPLLNQGELAVLYCFVFLYICARGGGIYSLDRAIAHPPGRT